MNNSSIDIPSLRSNFLKNLVGQNVSKFVRTALTVDEISRYRTLIARFDRLMKSENISYFLCAGSLIGAYRHHGPVPWDDDFDVQVAHTDFLKIRTLFVEKDPSIKDLRLKKPLFRPWKISMKGTPWPMIDMWPFYKNGDYILDATHHQWFEKFMIVDIYPLVQVPFLDLWLPAPKYWNDVIRQVFGDVSKICSSLHLSHRNWQHYRDATSIECNRLGNIFPFVVRACIGGSITETLRRGNEDLHVWKYVADAPDVPVDRFIKCHA
ncbi:uncharacterized protein RT0683-like [Tubulanus polymorphus]|uniref:uncharacterized protein RT0683-like n=1 Tax=Tubulanus polymorphus TaxID=672921 RepID=UPI003DA64630